MMKYRVTWKEQGGNVEYVQNFNLDVPLIQQVPVRVTSQLGISKMVILRVEELGAVI